MKNKIHRDTPYWKTDYAAFELGGIYGYLRTRNIIQDEEGYKYTIEDFDWIFYHTCGHNGGVYRITRKGKCYKCKKQLPPYKSLIFMYKMSKFNK